MSAVYRGEKGFMFLCFNHVAEETVFEGQYLPLSSPWGARAASLQKPGC